MKEQLGVPATKLIKGKLYRIWDHFPKCQDSVWLCLQDMSKDCYEKCRKGEIVLCHEVPEMINFSYTLVCGNKECTKCFKHYKYCIALIDGIFAMENSVEEL